MNKNTLLIIDSYALVYRAYYAFPSSLTNSKGEPTNAVYGFTSLLMDVLQRFTPTNIVAVFDSGGPTIRHADYTLYKANRSAADDLFVQQLPRVYEILKAFNIPIVMSQGVEADDLIGTIDLKHSGRWSDKKDSQTIIVTGDRDLFQLVDEDTFVYLAGSSFSQSKLYDSGMVNEKMGVTPLQIPDFKGLSGDTSDNIPGVKGIGPKGATDLIKEFGSVETIYVNIDKVNKKYQQKLLEGYQNALLSKKLATIDRNIPLSFDFETTKMKGINLKAIRSFFDQEGFKSLLGKLELFSKKFEIKQDDNYTLFDGFEDNNSVHKDKVGLEMKEWSGGHILQDEISIVTFFDHIEKNPLYWKIRELYYCTDETNVVFKVSEKEIKSFFEKNSSKKYITFDKKKLIHSFSNIGLIITYLDNIFDLGLNAVILGEGRVKFELKSVFEYFSIPFIDELIANIVKFKNIKNKIIDELANKTKIGDVIKLEEGILSTIIQMEQTGIRVDTELLNNSEKKLYEKLNNLRNEIYQNAGHEFNINSPKQVSDILFKEKLLPVNKKTKGGGSSTNENTLKKLIGSDPIIQNLLDFREIDKIMSTYILNLLGYVDKDGRIHAIFDQLGAVSGRFSSRNPNMQNIPLMPNHEVNIRDAFLSSDNSIFLSFDFSQQELRILAALSKEEVMINSFNNNIDIHKVTAAEIFEIDESEITKEQRNVGKTINFSVIYGISSYGLAELMQIDRKLADEFIKKYFNKYARVEQYLKSSVEIAKQQGFVETVMGRRRSNSMITSNNRMMRSAAERELFNFIIQGSAADIMKVAMSKFNNILKKYPAKLLLQIHDEFLFEYNTKDLNDPILKNFIKEIRDTMIGAYDLGVIYKVDVSIGVRWGSMNDFPIS